MPTTAKRAPAKTATPKAAARRQRTIDKLNDSLEAAQKAATAVGEDVSTGGRDILKEVERMIAAARKDAAKLGRAVRDDLGEFQKAISGEHAGATAHKAAAKKAPARKATPKNAASRKATPKTSAKA